MMFDHGTDSTVAWLLGWAPIVILVSGPEFVTYFALIPLVGPGFYLSQWCQYQMGFLKLSYINGADEGVTLQIIVLLLTCIFGKSIF